MKNRITLIFTLIVGLLLVSGLAAQDDARPFLGITFEAVDSGAVVTSIIPESAAETAGLENGDVITAVNGETVSADELAAVIGDLAPGDNITLDVQRGDAALSLDAMLQARPEIREQRRFQVRPFEPVEQAYLGVSLEVTDNGVSIVDVAPDSPAADAGLEVGDIITDINAEAIADAAAAAAIISDLEPGMEITLDIVRAGEDLTIEATLGSRMQSNFEMRGDMVVFDGTSWRILALTDDSPLAEAGLQAGDTITAINGDSVDPAALTDIITAAEGEVVLTIQRGDETLEIAVEAADLEAFNAFNFFGGRGEFIPFGDGEMPFRFDFAPGNVRLGVMFQTLDETVAADNDLTVTEGALITEVLADSAAAEAGLQVGDVITAVAGDVVDAERTLRDRLFAYEVGDTVTLAVLRADEMLDLEVTLAGVEMSADMLPFFGLDELPFDFNFDFGDGEFPRFFFGPEREFRFDPVQPAPNV